MPRRSLSKQGLRLSGIREELARATEEKQPRRGFKTLFEWSRDLTQAAMDFELDPVAGRDAEVEAVVQVLCRCTRSNPVLIGEPGVGRTAIVEGLAMRIADGAVPSFLADKRIWALDISTLVTFSRSIRLEERLRAIMAELMEAQNCVLFLGDLYPLADKEGARDAANVLKFLLSCESASFIGAMTPRQQRASEAQEHWISMYFCPIRVPPLAEEEALKILHSVKDRYQRFHAVAYTDNAIWAAVRLSALYIPDRHLPGKALDLLDDAGVHVKLKAADRPEEIVEVQKRIKFIVHRMENAIANQEFEKARFYSEEEHKERVALRKLREKYHLEGAAVVNEYAVAEVLAHKTGMPADVVRQQMATFIANKDQTG